MKSINSKDAMPCVSTLKEHPIIFSTPMVQAILEDRKTQTRRIIKPQPKNTDFDFRHNPYSFSIKKDLLIKCPYGRPGDLLWVRESFHENGAGAVAYVADEKKPNWTEYVRKSPSIHMPKKFTRIWLEVKDVRVERVQDISESDAIAEGIELLKDISEILGHPNYKDYNDPFNDAGYVQPKTSFFSLWLKINGWKSWESNPWVWVVEYEIFNRIKAVLDKEEA